MLILHSDYCIFVCVCKNGILDFLFIKGEALNGKTVNLSYELLELFRNGLLGRIFL